MRKSQQIALLKCLMMNFFSGTMTPTLTLGIATVLLTINLTDTVEVISKTSPMLFKKRGTVEISGKNYITILDINLDGLLNTIAPIGTQIRDISNGLETELAKIDQKIPRRRPQLLEESYTQDNHSDSYKAISVALNGHMRSHLRFLLADLQDKHDQLTSFLQTIGNTELDPTIPHSTSKRLKRGMVDGGGQLLKWLLGVATETDVEDTQSLVDRVTKLAEKTRVEVNLHSKILNTTSMNFARVDDHMAKITSCLGQIRGNILSLSQAAKDNTAHTFSIVHSIIMTNSLSYASSAISDLANQFLNLKIGLSKFRTGYLSPEIVPPATILNLIEEITQRNLRPIYPANIEFLPLIYQYIKVIPIPLSPLSFIISTPLIGDPKIQLNLYEVFNMPHPISSQLTMTYSNIPKYIGITNDGLYYQEYDDMDSCRHQGTFFFCNTDLPVYREEAPSCIVNLFRDTSDEICDKHFSGPLTRPKLVKTDVGWLYSVSKDSKVSITCPNNTTRVTLPQGSGRLHTGPQCKISGKEFILPTDAEPSGHAIILNTTLVSPFDISLSENELEKIALMEKSDILTNIMTLNNDRLPLKSLKSEVKNLAYIKKMRQINSVTGLALSTLSFIGVIFLIVTIIVFCKAASQQKNKEKIVQYFNQPKEESVLLSEEDTIASEVTQARQSDHLELSELTQEDIQRKLIATQSPTLLRTKGGPVRLMAADRLTKTISHQSETLG